MSATYEENNRIVFKECVYESELEPLKAYMDQKKSALDIDLKACKDIHGAVIQLILAYKVQYSCTFEFSEDASPFKMALQGFSSIENDCH